MSKMENKATRQIIGMIVNGVATKVSTIDLAKQILSIPELAIVDREAELPNKYERDFLAYGGQKRDDGSYLTPSPYALGESELAIATVKALIAKFIEYQSFKEDMLKQGWVREIQQ